MQDLFPNDKSLTKLRSDIAVPTSSAPAPHWPHSSSTGLGAWAQGLFWPGTEVPGWTLANGWIPFSDSNTSQFPSVMSIFVGNDS